MPEKYLRPYLILAEGVQDQKFLDALLQSMQLENIQVSPKGGKEQIVSNLPAIAIDPTFLSNVIGLAVIRDADDNANSAFHSVYSALEKSNLPTPSEAGVFTTGTYAETTSFRVGVLILPPSQNSGALEDVVLASIEKNDQILQCVEDYFACVESSAPITNPRQLSKAKIQAFLAAKDPEKRIAETSIWNFNHPAFNKIKEFIRDLVGSE